MRRVTKVGMIRAGVKRSQQAIVERRGNSPLLGVGFPGSTSLLRPLLACLATQEFATAIPFANHQEVVFRKSILLQVRFTRLVIVSMPLVIAGAAANRTALDVLPTPFFREPATVARRPIEVEAERVPPPAVAARAIGSLNPAASFFEFFLGRLVSREDPHVCS